MENPLENMTDEQRWRLFPIELSAHNPCWHDEYILESSLIKQKIGDNVARINHIGSTAVSGLSAKPIVDILLEIAVDTDLGALTSALVNTGYILTPQPKNPAPHMTFLKGYTPDGYKGQAFHLHIRYSGDWDELYFRDYLAAHPETAREYASLKFELAKKYPYNRDAYTDAKTYFIKNATAKAREDFPQKYK